MNIYTYFEDFSHSRENIALLTEWRRNWERHGWTPVVLGREDAMKNPRYGEYVKRFSLYPTVNNPNYELCCFLRWVAMEMVGGYHCDFDVMNNGFKGEHRAILTFYSKYLVPAMVWGDKDDYSRMLALFMGYDYKGKRHVSDQDILVENVDTFPHEKRYMMPEIEQEGNWFNYELIHYPNMRMAELGMNPRSVNVERFNRIFAEYDGKGRRNH